uniref:Uncharacterized protein n=1 Tax=Anguilla anguilla TaxID=7936 RepID=A0A0E9VZE7_ANGAN
MSPRNNVYIFCSPFLGMFRLVQLSITKTGDKTLSLVTYTCIYKESVQCNYRKLCYVGRF